MAQNGSLAEYSKAPEAEADHLAVEVMAAMVVYTAAAAARLTTLLLVFHRELAGLVDRVLS